MKLKASTAEFKEGLSKAQADLRKLKGEAGETGQGIRTSMFEARGSLMLLEESVGVRIPRHLNALIARMPGVGQAFALMLPVAGVIAAIDVITKLIEKHDEAKKKALEQAEGWRTLGESISTHNDELQVSIEKNKELIAKLEHKPINNTALAIAEARVEADKLAKSLQTDIDKMLKLLETGARGKLLTAVLGEGTNQASDILNDFKDKLREIPKDADFAKNAGALTDESLQAALRAQDQLARNKKENDELVSQSSSDLDVLNLKPFSQEAFDGLKKVIDGLNDYKDTLDFVQAKSKGDETVRGLQKENEAREKAKKALEQEVALQKTLGEGVKAHAAAVREVADAAADETAAEIVKDPKRTLAEKLNAEIEAAKQRRAAAIREADIDFEQEEKVFAKERAAAQGNKHALEEIDIREENAKQKHMDRLSSIELTAIRNVNAATRKSASDRERILEQSQQHEIDLAVSNDQKRISGIENNAKDEIDIIQNRAKLGQTSRIKEQQQIEAALQREQVALQAAQAQEQADLQANVDKLKEIAEQARGTESEGTANQNLIRAQEKLTEASRKAATAQEDLRKKIRDVNTEGRILQSSWHDFFKSMKTDTEDLSTKIRVNLQGSIKQFTRSFSDSMAKAIVENKSLGEAVRAEAAHMLESLLSTLIQWLEQWIITHTIAKIIGTKSNNEEQLSAARLAGANMVASWAAAPFPIDALAPAMGAQAFAAAMAFERGGKIPGAGAVPIIAHGGETVITRALTERVEQSEGNNRSTGGNNLRMNVNFSPQVMAFDAEGVDKILKKHGAAFASHMTKQLRRLNQ